MYTWSTNSLLRLHPGKYYAVYIHNQSKQRSLPNYQINTKGLGNKSEMKNLGITVNENLGFSNHTRDEVNTANQSMGLIRKTSVQRN